MPTDHTPVKDLRRGELARATGCNAETIRYYETIGLMPDPPRSPAGHRRYDAGHADRLGFIMGARQLGFSLDEIRSLLSLTDRGAHTCAEVREAGRRHLAAVRARIADLRRIERVLDDTVARCTGTETPDCPLLEALRAGQGTTGIPGPAN